MDIYSFDPALFDFANFSDQIIRFNRKSLSSSSASDDYGEVSTSSQLNSSSNQRHDGMSPLPLGMEWSFPPRKWDGRDSIWPNDPQTGWSYCTTIPTWVRIRQPRGSDPVVFFRVEVGIQSPEGITTTREVLQRFSDFFKLLADLKKAFPGKHLPPAPPRRILSTKSRTMLEKRRCSLEEWIQKLLSDIDVSRSTSVAMFLELEAAARASFHTEDLHNSDVNTDSNISVFVNSSPTSSNHGNKSPDSISETEILKHGLADFGVETSTSRQDQDHVTDGVKRHAKRDVIDSLTNRAFYNLDGQARRLSSDSIKSDLTSVRVGLASDLRVDDLFEGSANLTEGVEISRIVDTQLDSNVEFSRDSLVILLVEERQKLKRVLNTIELRLSTAKTDMEDLIARLNQELAVRKFLDTKVKDLEVELEITRHGCKENMQQALLTEREKFTQLQWDVEDFRKRCFEMEMTLKAEQDEKARTEVAKASVIQENEMLMQELNVSEKHLLKLHTSHDEVQVKLKGEVKVLAKEVKSLRSSESALKQELSCLMKEKLKLERTLQEERGRKEYADTANAKLLHECQILCNRLQECSVSFLAEEEDELVVENSSPTDAIDILMTSDNRIGLLLAEAQLLAQDIESSIADWHKSHGNSSVRKVDNELTMLLTDVLVDNARLRMQVNSVIHHTLRKYANTDKSEEEEEEEEEKEEESPLRKTVLSKLLEL